MREVVIADPFFGTKLLPMHQNGTAGWTRLLPMHQNGTAGWLPSSEAGAHA
jgi:hypothetical protein